MPVDLTTIILGFGGFVLIVLLLLRVLYLSTKVVEVLDDKRKIVLKIAIPRNNDKSPLAAEQLYSALHGIIRGAEKSKFHFSFEIVAGVYGIHFMVVTDTRYRSFIENQIYAQYPEAQISQIPDYTDSLEKTLKYSQVIELGLSREHYLPIRTFANFEVDPLASITSAISKLTGDDEVWIQIVVRPINNIWQVQGKSFVDSRKQQTDVEGKKVALESGESVEISEIERKNTKVGYQFAIRVLARSKNPEIATLKLEDCEASFKQFQTPHLNSIVKLSKGGGIFFAIKHLIIGYRKNDKLSLVKKYRFRLLDERTKHILNIEELASLFHLPNKTVKTPNIAWALSNKLEFPLNLPSEEDKARIIGVTDYRGQRNLFGIKELDRTRHMYILGKTGTGKSTMMKNMIMADIYEGKGVGVIDPHGDLIEDLLQMIPRSRADDIVIFDPADIDFPIGLNMLHLKNQSQKDLVADGIVEVFKKHFGNSWGPRLQYLLLNAVLTLIQCQNVSLLAVTRILSDKNYRNFLLKQIKDPILLNFWNEEFKQMESNPRLLAEALAPIQNKVGRFISSPMIRNMVGQVKSTIDIEQIMNEGKILLVNLSQGKIGEENSGLLGGMLITRIFSSAMERVKIPEAERKNFFLYVDEFQTFTTNTFVKILSEARKYGLALTVAHQYIDQLDTEVSSAIFGNIGSMANFTLGPSDAIKLVKEYQPYLEADDLVNLDRYRFVTKIMIDGSQSKPFTALSLKPQYNEVLGVRDYIVQNSRKKYAGSREAIEQKIAKWSTQRYNENGNLIQHEYQKLPQKDKGVFSTNINQTKR